MQYLTTRITLPAGPLSMSTAHEFLRLVFDEYKWFRPMRYGFALLKRPIDPVRIDYDALLAYFNDMKAITVAARTERDFIQIFTAKPDEPPNVGKIIWETSVKEAKRPEWRAAHLRQVGEVMRTVGSAVAQSGLAEDYQLKNWRIIPSPDGVGQQLVFTVRDYSEGLTGIYWRNFFGPPFVRLFGERLDSLPPGCTKEELEGGIVLVQPYELPTLAGTPEGIARERALIEHLGPECFYDHERHLKPSRLPELPPPPTTTGEPGQA